MIAEVAETVESEKTSPRAWARPWFIFFVALTLRLAVIPFLVGDQLNPAHDHWVFGWETGRIARALASGQGFASPLFGSTGPTAWMGPIYPALLAGVFKVFGIYSKASAYVILSLNCFFAALTCLPLRSIALTMYGRKTSTAVAWTWVLFPYSFNFSADLVWATTLATLLLTQAVAMTIALERKLDALSWVVWGMTWALVGLTEPALLACAPVAALWLFYRLRKRGRPWIFFERPLRAALAFFLLLAPWCVRNQRVFGHFIPLRSNFWLAFYQGNTWDTFDLYPDWANPPHNAAEMAEYARVGEVAYMAEKKDQAMATVLEHPARFAWTTLRRIVFTWTGYWNLSSTYRRIEPLAVPNILMTTLLSLLAASGLAIAFKRVGRYALLFAGLLLTFPAVYYVTHPGMAYRHPVDPVLILLGVSAFTTRGARPETQAPKREVEIGAGAQAGTYFPS